MSLLLLFPSAAVEGPPLDVRIDDAKVIFAGIDRSVYAQQGSVRIVRKQNERSTATLVLLPGFIPTQYSACQIYDIDGLTLVFDGIVLQAGSESLEQGSSLHKTNVSLADAMVFTDWCFWTKTYATPVPLLQVIDELIFDKLLAYGISRDPAQDVGETLDPFTVGSDGVGQKVSDFLRNLAAACHPPRVVQMNVLKQLRLVIPGTDAAPFNIGDAVPHCLDLNWTHTDFTPANRVVLTCGPTGTAMPTQTWTVQTTPVTWEVDIQAVVNGGTGGGLFENPGAGQVFRTVSPPGLGGYYYWDDTVGKGTLSIGLGARPPNGTVLSWVYTAQYPFTVTASSGETPIVEAQFSDPNQLLLAPAQAAVDGALARLNQSPRTATILTLDPGLRPNQSISITRTDRDIVGVTFSITEVQEELTTYWLRNRKMWMYTAQATESLVYQGSYLDQARNLFGGGGGSSTAVISGGTGGTGGVTGTGTVGALPKWATATGLINSILSEASGTITAAGTLAANTFVGPLATTYLTGTLLNSTVSQANVTQHQGALSIAGSQLTGTIAAAVQDNITRVGTLVSGYWNAGAVTPYGNVTPGYGSTYDLGTSSLLWSNAYIAQINAVIFAKQTLSLYGGWLAVTKNAGSFAAQVNSGDVAVDFGQTMIPDQFILIRGADLGGVLTEEYMQVSALNVGTSYYVFRNLSGAGLKTWPKGMAYAVRGEAGDGWVELNAYDPPRMSVFTQGSAYNNSVENVRIGYLTGMPNSSSGIGVYMGDATNYFRWDGADITLVGADCTINNDGITLGTPTTFSNTSALKFVRAGGSGFGQTGDINGLYSTGFTGDATLFLMNAIRGLPAGSGGAAGNARITFTVSGWDNSGAGAAADDAQIYIQSTPGLTNCFITADITTISDETQISWLNLVGGQISFPATQNPASDANTLDDYQEDNWTPTLGSSGGGTPTYTTQFGHYIKIGRRVSVSGRIILATKGDLAAGNVSIEGLPYTSAGTYYGHLTFVYFGNFVTTITFLSAFVVPGSGGASLVYLPAGGATVTNALQVSDIGTTCDVTFFGEYFSAD